MSNYAKRGMSIGAYISQPLGNYVLSTIDHYMKERLRVKCYLRNCDDTVGLARTKSEARRQLEEYERLSAELGLVVKASAFYAPIRYEGAKKKRRKRQRGRKRQGD